MDGVVDAAIYNCDFCGVSFARKRPNQRFCSGRCKWTDNNSRRVLPANVHYVCEVCGVEVHRYVAPSKQPHEALRYCGRACKGKALSGAAHPMWRGGRRVNDQGYVLVYQPSHPHADNKGLVREHRLVMEQVIGRLLQPREVVHHVNGDRADNRPENLQLLPDNAAHKRMDIHQRQRNSKGRLLPLSSAEKGG